MTVATPARRAHSVRARMGLTLLALLPAIGMSTWWFGIGVLQNITLAGAFALMFEAAMLALRRQPLWPFLSDGSAVLSAALFALCLPPAAPWWLLAIGMAAGIVVAKQLFGGLGRNLFNPAMASLATVWLGFPEQFLTWPRLPGTPGLALALALGGLALLGLRIVRWQTPVALLNGGIVVCALLWLATADALGPPPLRWASWPMLLCAFFIASDPVTGCYTPRGRIAFGLGVGALAVLLGEQIGTIAGIAFAVLLMNCLARWLDARLEPVRP